MTPNAQCIADTVGGDNPDARTRCRMMIARIRTVNTFEMLATFQDLGIVEYKVTSLAKTFHDDPHYIAAAYKAARTGVNGMTLDRLRDLAHENEDATEFTRASLRHWVCRAPAQDQTGTETYA